MGSKTKIIAFFLLFCLIIPLVLAQENPNMITIFNNVEEVPERPSHDIEFNGITIIAFYQWTFTPESEDIEPKLFILDFENEYSAEKLDLKDILKEGSALTGTQEDVDRDRCFFFSFLDENPFVRYELKPLEVKGWKINNITLNGSIRVHATIFKHGFCSISLVFPIITKDLKNEYEGDFLIADKPLKTDDIVFIEGFDGSIPLKGENKTIFQIFKDNYSNLKNKFFRENEKNEELCIPWRYTAVYAWNITKTLKPAYKLVEENPWEVYGICAQYSEWYVGSSKEEIFSIVSEVFSIHPDNFQIFYPERVGYFEYAQNPNKGYMRDYGYDPSRIRLAELIYLQAYMLKTYNYKLSRTLEELRYVKEEKYHDKIKDIVNIKREIIISVDQFYLIEDSLKSGSYRNFIRYGKQRNGLDFIYENLRDKMEDLSEISADMNNVIAQEKMKELTWIGIALTVIILLVSIFGVSGSILRRLRERRAKK